MDAPAPEDLAYHMLPAGSLLTRLYRPAGDGPFPAAVSVHGGRWCAETRLTNAAIDRALAAAGIVSMAIDFRMPPIARYPEPVADINLAIRWLKAHAADFRIDAARIGGIGTSSGGHQLLLNALKPRDARHAALPLPGADGLDASLAFAVACWPVTDPLARYRHAIEHDMTLHVDSHHAYWPDEAAMNEGSPQRIVEQGEASHLPPLLLIQGTADVVLPPGTSERFAAAWAKAGGAVELATYPGEGHTFITKQPDGEHAQAALRRIVSFIRQQA
jgi:acetyl esterase/lipase